MKSRQQIQQEILISLKNDMVRQRKNWNDVCLCMPRKGKNSWTFREVYDSVKEDKCLEGADFNEIDSVIHYYEWKEKK